MASPSNENIVKIALLEVEQEDKFAVDTPRANLAKNASKFILTAETSVVDAFCQKLLGAVNRLVLHVKEAGYKSFSTIHERLWQRFHDCRSGELKDIWRELWLHIGDKEFPTDRPFNSKQQQASSCG